jgi:hybrid cluster-associated redox disulfide protein
VASLLEAWPETAQVFVQHQMACPGCYLAEFDTLEGALQTYQIGPQPFLSDLQRIVKAQTSAARWASQERPGLPGESRHD